MFDLNMADPRNSCPTNWTFHEGPFRGCRRKLEELETCESVLIPVTMNYSMICGRIHTYQRGSSIAFCYSISYGPGRGINVTIENPYVSGLSLTHGVVGQRKHVWTFTGAWDETSRDYKDNTSLYVTSCPCINPALTWPYTVPFYVGDSYFCDTGAHTFIIDYTLYMNDPLWDGEGCGGSSTCCNFSSPPWFCQHLKYHTSDDLELRLCSFDYSILRRQTHISCRDLRQVNEHELVSSILIGEQAKRARHSQVCSIEN